MGPATSPPGTFKHLNMCVESLPVNKSHVLKSQILKQNGLDVQCFQYYMDMAIFQLIRSSVFF